MKGTLYGVGVGPGDPELLTVKAVKIIGQCPVVAAPDSGSGEQIALQIAQAYLSGKEILLCDMPMTRDMQKLQLGYQQAADAICGQLEQGKDVAFLTIGDPSIYATYNYVDKLVRQAGYQVCVIPGIPSFCAAAAALQEPLCERNQPLHILPAAHENLPELLEQDGTKVIMKMGKKREAVLELLREKGLAEQAAMVERCSMPDESVTVDLSGIASGSGYFSMIVVKEDASW